LLKLVSALELSRVLDYRGEKDIVIKIGVSYNNIYTTRKTQHFLIQKNIFPEDAKGMKFFDAICQLCDGRLLASSHTPER
jgi:hypothetical protein